MSKKKTSCLMREMGKFDMPTVMAIERASFRTAPWKSEESFLNGKRGRSFVVSEKRRIVGFAVSKRSKADDAIEIVKMATHPEHRGKGFGKFILSWVKGYAGEEGVIRVLLRVRKANMVARQLYQREGFSEIRLLRDYYRSGSTAGERAAVEMQCLFPMAEKRIRL